MKIPQNDPEEGSFCGWDRREKEEDYGRVLVEKLFQDKGELNAVISLPEWPVEKT